MIRSALTTVCFLALASPASAIGLYCAAEAAHPLPADARHEPTVPYVVHAGPAGWMDKNCPLDSGAAGCTFSLDDGKTWVIVIDDEFVGTDDWDCILRYEKAHLAPNCFIDRSFEHPEAIEEIRRRCRR